MSRTLREHQQAAYDAVRAEWDSGTTRTAVVHATGLGKGDLIAKMAVDEVAAGGRTLILAHREEILTQLAERARAYDPAAKVGLIKGQRTQRQHPITAASIQTVGTRLRRLVDATPSRAARIERTLPLPPSLVLVDECHRAAGDLYLETLRHYGSFNDVRTCGFTATMVRGDRRGLGGVWSSVADSRGIDWAIRAGLLVRPHGKVVVASHVDLNAAKVSRGDYQDGDLGEMIEQDADQIVKAWHEHAVDRLTIAFAPTVASAQALTDEFVAAGVPAECVTGATPSAERTAMYRRLRTGATRVLVNVFVLVEGWDCPPVSCLLMARPTRLPGVYQQALGRILRPHEGKADALVLDVVGASRTQRLTTLVDLSPSADYDTTAVDALPCEVCGLPTKGEPPLCTCPPEDGERDPSGGRRRLIGPATYEDLDLLLQTSGCVWLSTHGGVPFLPTKERTAILWHNRRLDLYVAGHMANRGRKDGVWLSPEPESLDAARRRAEAWALEVDPTLASRSSSWRADSRRPGPQQIEMALRLGIPNPQAYTRGRLSDEISIVKVSERLR